MPRSPRTTHTRFYDTLRQTRDFPTGGQGRPPLQDVLRFCRWGLQFCNCVLPGRAGHRPLRHIALSPHIVRFCGCILRGRGRASPLRLDWQHGQNPHQRAERDNIKRGMLKRASLFWYRRREYSGGAAASVPPRFSFGTASAARTACRGAKFGRSNDGFSQHHGIKKRGALVSVPLFGTGDGNRTRMAQCRGILSPLCLPVPPRRRTCVFYHSAPPASRGAPRKRPPSCLDGGLIFKLLRR